MLNQIEAPALPSRTAASELKAALAKAFIQADRPGALERVNQITRALPIGSRFLIRPKRSSPLAIMGWQDNKPGSKVNQRGTAVDPRHSFSGNSFKFAGSKELVLQAGNANYHPWCRLSFEAQSGRATFDLAVIPPAMPSNLAQFV